MSWVYVFFPHICICIESGNHVMVRECNGSALQSSISSPTYIPLNLQPQMTTGPPQTKRPMYFGPATDPEQPATSCTWSSGTPIMVDDKDELEDPFDQESYYISASSAKTAEEVKAFIGSTFRRSIPKRKCQEMDTLNQTSLHESAKNQLRHFGRTRRRVSYE